MSLQFLSLASAAVSGLGSLSSSSATAGVHSLNADIQRTNAKINRKQAKIDMFLRDKERRRLLGANIAAAGSSGFVLGDGAVESILSADLSEQYALGLIDAKGEIAAAQDLTRAAYNDYQAEATIAAAPTQAVNSAFSAIGGLEGAQSIYGRLTKPSINQAPIDAQAIRGA